MEIDPHTLQQIIQRIQQQMRCPQCGRRLQMDFNCVKVVASDALLLQLKCEGCNAYIVLHASMQGQQIQATAKADDIESLRNVSSMLFRSEEEVKVLRSELEKSGGSFQEIFAKKAA